ncbi:hypothetical protein ACHFCA_13095 [Delftia tsuruhatensis]
MHDIGEVLLIVHQRMVEVIEQGGRVHQRRCRALHAGAGGAGRLASGPGRAAMAQAPAWTRPR